MKAKDGILKFQDKLYNFYIKSERNKFLSSLKQGFIMLVPVFMIGAMALLIRDFPIVTVKNFILTACNGFFYDLLTIVFFMHLRNSIVVAFGCRNV